MYTSHGAAAQRALWKLPLGSLVLVASAGVGLFTGDATAGLSPAQSCAAKKLKEAAKVVGTMLKCVQPPGPPTDQGLPPGPCIQAAGARLTETFVKLEAKGDCIATDDATAIRETIESLVRKLTVPPSCAAIPRSRQSILIASNRAAGSSEP
jgi:hypothetical protein